LIGLIIQIEKDSSLRLTVWKHRSWFD